MGSGMKWAAVVGAAAFARPAAALANGAALTPPLGFSNWNMWHNNINASLFLDVATFMKDNGFLDAGYNYITLGGIGYANNSGPGGNITRNAAGMLQVDPVRFPGGNAGMKSMISTIQAMGFKWGSYTEAGTAGCNGVPGSSEVPQRCQPNWDVVQWDQCRTGVNPPGGNPAVLLTPPAAAPAGYESEDAELFFDEWQSEYLMIDSCGVKPRPPPFGPPPNTPGGQARWEMTRWVNLSLEYQRRTNRTVLIHDCHNGCISSFAGPTLAIRACDPADPYQQFQFDPSGDPTSVVDGGFGLCVGCGSKTSAGPLTGSCANDALALNNGSGFGIGLQGCIVSCSHDPDGDSNGRTQCVGNGLPAGLGKDGQTFAFNTTTSMLTRVATGECFLPLVGKDASQVALAPAAVCAKSGVAGWKPVPVGNGAGYLLQMKTDPESCVSSHGNAVPMNMDPWCAQNNNMWRSNTDVLQVWTRIMIEVESMANQGAISHPGAWSFPDCSELGTPGMGTLTWEESKSVLALFAVTSSPILLGNDPRPHMMQQRLVELYLNKDMLAINQQYAQGNAGGRVLTRPGEHEVWAKPLTEGAAVVLFNRGGTVIGVSPPGAPPLPAFCHSATPHPPCVGCFLDDGQHITAPCDDNATASSPPQTVHASFSELPPSWLGLKGGGGTAIGCDVFDVFATPQVGKSLGHAVGNVSALIPPHGAKFLRLTNCAYGPWG